MKFSFNSIHGCKTVGFVVAISWKIVDPRTESVLGIRGQFGCWLSAATFAFNFAA